MEELITKLTPETLARLAAAMSDLLNPDMDQNDFAIVNTISNKIFDIGTEKAGIDFHLQYFDAVAAAS